MSHWRRFVSWNSSTMICRKRSCSALADAASSRSRSRTSSWRSSKSSDRLALASRPRTRRRTGRAAPAAARCRARRARRAPPAGAGRAQPRNAAVRSPTVARCARSSSCSGFDPRASAAAAAARCFSVASGSAASVARRRPGARRAARRRLPGAELERTARARPSEASRRRRSASGAARRAPYVASRRSRSGSPSGAERGQRALERLATRTGAWSSASSRNTRVDADRERMRAQQARAEAVDGRDPGAVEPAREIGTAALAERGADARAELAGRLPRVRDHEHRLDVEPLLAHRAHEPLDEHRRLSGAGAGRDEDLASGRDRARCCSGFMPGSRSLDAAHRPEVAPRWDSRRPSGRDARRRLADPLGEPGGAFARRLDERPELVVGQVVVPRVPGQVVGGVRRSRPRDTRAPLSER